MTFSFFLSIYSRCGAPASWAARHTTVCLDPDIESLVKYYRDKNCGHYLENLYFSGNHLSLAGARDLAKIVKKSKHMLLL